MSITIDVAGIDQAVANLARYEEESKLLVADAQARAAMDTTTLAKRNAPVFDGRLRSSIRPRLDPAALTAEVFTDVNYAPSVEYGSRPHMPPVDALTRWALIHGISPWALAMAIKKHGTRPRPFLGPAWEAIRPHYIENVAAALREAGVKL